MKEIILIWSFVVGIGLLGVMMKLYKRIMKCDDVNEICGIDLTRIPSHVFTNHILVYLEPYKYFSFARINKHFSIVLSIKKYNFEINKNRDLILYNKYIKKYYDECGGWLVMKLHKIDDLITKKYVKLDIFQLLYVFILILLYIDREKRKQCCIYCIS